MKIGESEKKNLPFFLICAGGIVILILIGIIPNNNKLYMLDTEIAKKKNEIQTQEFLFPIYTDIIKTNPKKDLEGLPFQEKKNMPESEIADIPKIFSKLAEEFNIKLKSVNPDPNTLDKKNKLLAVHIDLEGKFFDYRNFLIKLIGIPYLEFVENIQVNVLNDNLNMNIKLWLTIE
ncbi:MAG: hypothetical protein HQK76_00815 [Desulfobacterales bacterium]|nr:hypothetical protein [Desulfobacterales bacterium]